MRPQAKNYIIEDAEILMISLRKDNWRTAYRYARSITRRLKPFAGAKFLVVFRNMAPGDVFPVKPRGLGTTRVYASKASKILKRRFSVKRSKAKPGTFICKRER